VMNRTDRHILVDAGPFGPWGSGHSHSDTLGIVVRSGDREILIDPGTYTYMGAERDWFRGSAAHNTVRVDGLDQATPVNPFRWSDQPAVSVRAWTTSEEEDFLDAECVARGITHRRRIRFVKPDLLLIVDEISGPTGEHLIEQFWHLGSLEHRGRISVDDGAEVVESWRSEVFGAKHPAVTLRVSRRGALPLRLTAAIHLGEGR
jgi:Heparinase II/III-like protein